MSDLPEGRVVAIHAGSPAIEVGEPIKLEPGPLRETLTVRGQPLEELAPGTRLRLGGALVIELVHGPGGGGLLEVAGDSERGAGGLRPARVVAGGVVRLGDAVVIESVAIPVEDALDLHPFGPDEIPDVVREYLVAAHAAGHRHVRLIHGRGRGVQRAAVRRVLAASPLVASFADAPPDRGGWGATVLELRAGGDPTT